VILFFDRNVGTKIPLALIDLNPRGLQIEYHDKHFAQNETDDVWLAEVGKRDWFVIGQDHNFHNNSPELEAIRQHRVGVFYLWGAEEPKWEVMRCFAAGFDKIVHRASVTERPFAFKVQRHGGVTELFVV